MINSLSQPANDLPRHNGELLESFVNELIIFFSNKIGQDLCIPKVAKKSGYTQWYLHEKLKEVMGFTASHYIRDLRLRRAFSLITETHMTMLDIALSCKLPNQQHFSRFIRTKYKLTP